MALQNSVNAKAAMLVALAAIYYDVVGLHPIEEALICLAAIGCCFAAAWCRKPKAGGSGGTAKAWVPDAPKQPAPAWGIEAPKNPGLSASAVSLCHAIMPLLGKGADGDEHFSPVLVPLLKGQDVDEVNDALAGMLEQIGVKVEAQLLDAVRQIASTIGTERSPRLQEIIIKDYLYLDMHAEFQELFEKAREAGIATQKVAVLALHHSCANEDLKTALELVPVLIPLMPTPTTNLQDLVKQLVHIAVKGGLVSTLITEFVRHGLMNPLTVGALLCECSQHRDFASVKKVAQFARSRGVELSDMAFSGLIRASRNANEALQLFEEAVEKQCMGGEVIAATAHVAISHKDKDLARTVVHSFHESAGLAAAASILCMLYKGPDMGVDPYDAILETYDNKMQNIDLLGIPKVRHFLVNAVVTRNRADLLERLVKQTHRFNQFKVIRYLAYKVQSQSKCFSLSLLTTAFKACNPRFPCHYTAFVKGLINCGELSLAEKFMAEAVADGMANDTTFYTVISTLLDRNDYFRAHATIEGIIPWSLKRAMGASNFHMEGYTELITKLITLEDYRGAWMLFDKMDFCGLTPDRSLCIEMMRTISKETRAEFEDRATSLVGRCWGELNEVMVCEVARGWMRCGNVRGLRQLMDSQRVGSFSKVRLASTASCKTLMKAWAFLRDSAGVKAVWAEACALVEVPPADVQASAVESLVRSGDPDGGLTLVRHLLAGKQTQRQARSDLYCHVIGGLTQQMRFKSVWDLQEELVTAGVELTKGICLALLKACESAREMHRADALLEYMEKNGISRDASDYLTVMSGYCREGRLDRAFGVLAQMRASSSCRPDESTYKTLIEACAARDLHDSGMMLLEEMVDAGVPVTTATLVSVMKLAGNEDVDQAEKLVDSLCRKHGLSPDKSVFDRLILVSTTANQWERALQIFQRMIGACVRPDSNTYTRVIKACMQAGRVQDAVGMIRSAVGLPRGHPCLASFDAGECWPSDNPKARMLVDWLEAVADVGEEAAVALLQDVRTIPDIKLAHRLFRRAALVRAMAA